MLTFATCTRSNDGRLACACSDGSIRLLSSSSTTTETTNKEWTCIGDAHRDGETLRVVALEEQDAFISSGADGTVALWSWNGGEKTRLTLTANEEIYGLARLGRDSMALGTVDMVVGIDLEHFSSRTFTKRFKAINSTTPAFGGPHRNPSGSVFVFDLACSLDNTIACALSDGTCRIIDTRSGSSSDNVGEVASLFHSNQMVTSCRFHPTQTSCMLTTSGDGSVKIWDLRKNASEAIIQLGLASAKGPCYGAMFMCDDTIVSWTGDVVQTWSETHLTQLTTFGPEYTLYGGVLRSDDDDTIVMCGGGDCFQHKTEIACSHHDKRARQTSDEKCVHDHGHSHGNASTSSSIQDDDDDHDDGKNDGGVFVMPSKILLQGNEQSSSEHEHVVHKTITLDSKAFLRF